MTTLDRLRAALDPTRPQTLQELGNQVGVTRQRIGQLLKQHDGLVRTAPVWPLGPRAFAPVPCTVCHKPILGKTQYERLRLQKTIPNTHCRSCWALHNYVTFQCDTCDKAYTLDSGTAKARKAGNTSGRFYCSKKCQGRWFGNTHGWGEQQNSLKLSHARLLAACKATSEFFGPAEEATLYGEIGRSYDSPLNKLLYHVEDAIKEAQDD
jgi:hypothetical protein